MRRTDIPATKSNLLRLKEHFNFVKAGHALLDQKRDLEVKEAGLLSPERLNSLAKVHSLGSPVGDQVVHLDTTAAEGSFARNETPVVPTQANLTLNKTSAQ